MEWSPFIIIGFTLGLFLTEPEAATISPLVVRTPPELQLIFSAAASECPVLNIKSVALEEELNVD